MFCDGLQAFQLPKMMASIENYQRRALCSPSARTLTGAVFCCCLVLLSLHVQPTSAQAVRSSDTYGNVIYDNGTVIFVRPMPVGNGAYKTKTDYEKSGLEILFSFARSFINTVMSDPFPFDILKRMMNGEFNFGEDYMEVVKYAMGFAVCFAIGLLFIVMFALCGCCVCCCRTCCGNCGGDGLQTFDENEGCKRMGYGQMLFMMCICMFVAGACVYVTNDQFATAVSFANSTTSNNLDNLEMYFINTSEEFKYLLTDLYNLVQNAVDKDIDNLGTVAEEGISKLLNFTAVFDAVHDLGKSVSSITVSLSQVRTDITALESVASTLSTILNTLANDIDTTKTGCAGDCAPNLCSNIDTNTIRGASFDTSNLPNLDSMQTAVDSVNSANLSGISDTVETSLDGISGTIQSGTATVRSAAKTTMSDYAVLIGNMTGGVIDSMKNAFPISDTKNMLAGYFEMAQEYDIYREYVGLGLTSAFLGLVGLFVLGMMMGVLCDDKKKLPTERGFCSNCGGCLIMMAVMLMFVLGPILMLLTSISFLIGGLLEKTCQPMLDLTLFSEFVDTGAIPGFSLGALLLGDASVNLRVYDVLLGCRADKAPFDVMKLNTLIPLEDYLNFTKHLSGLDSDLNDITNLDISNYKVYTPTMQNALDDLQNSGITSINFTDINNQLNQPVTSFNTGTLIATMTTIMNSCSNPTKANWANHIATVTDIQTTKIPAVNAAITTLKASLATLESDIAPVDPKINTARTVAQAADNQIQNNMTAVLTESANSVKNSILAYLEQYGNEATYLVYNEIGNCLPIWNLYRSFTVMLCNVGVDALNGFWFSLGWGLFFFIPVVIVGITLSGYYSTKDKIKGWPEPEEEHDDEDFDDFQSKLDYLDDRDTNVNADYVD